MWEKAEAYNREVSKKYVQKPKNAKVVEHYGNTGYGVDKLKSQALEERKKNQKFIVWYKSWTLIYVRCWKFSYLFIVQMAEFVSGTERKKYNGYGKPIQNVGYT